MSVAGVIGGGGGLTKVGAGTLTLTGANRFGGLTGVSGGTLILANAWPCRQEARSTAAPAARPG